MLAKVFSVSELCKLISSKWPLDNHGTPVEACGFLGLHQCPALQWNIFHLSPVPTHLFGLMGLSALCMHRRRKNCRDNYKEQRKKVGVCTTKKYQETLCSNSALQRNQNYLQQWQPSVGSNESCMGSATGGRACRKSVFLIRDTQYKHLIHLKVFAVMFAATKKFYRICYHSWDTHSIKVQWNPVAAVKVGTQA